MSFCVTCGERNPDSGKYCYKCGNPLWRGEETKIAPNKECPVQETEAARQQREEQELLVRELLSIDLKLNQCHGCTATNNLSRHKFGLGKIVKSKRLWTPTILSAAVSAVSLATVGYGMIQTPGKRKTLRVLRLELMLCKACRESLVDWKAHPWWNKAHALGYKEFLSEKALNELQPA